MNIDALFYVDSFGGGGIERNRVRLANAFSERGLRVALIVHKDAGPFRDRLDPALQVCAIGRGGRLVTLVKLIRELRAQRPRVLISAAPERNILSLAAARLAGTGMCVVISEHNHFSVSLRAARPRAYYLLRAFARWLYPKAHAVIAISKGVADDLERELKLPKGQVQVVYNPVIPEDIDDRMHDTPDHPWLSADRTGPVVIAAGRLRPAKGFDLLLKAFAPIHAQHDARLIIVGEGEERDKLVAQASALGLADAVSFPGFVPNPYAYMARGNLFVLSSRYEGLGNVLIEAMACGCPVVSADCPSGPREILKDGALGRLVPPDNAAALTAAMDAALTQPGPVAAARDHAMTFTVATSAGSYAALSGLKTELHP